MICRACGGHTQSTISLLHPSYRKLKAHIIQIDGKFESAGYPTSVCEACLGALTEWSNFTSQSNKVQELFDIAKKMEETEEKKHVVAKPTALQKWLQKDQNSSSKTVTIKSQISKYNLKTLEVRVERLSQTVIEKLTNVTSELDSDSDFENYSTLDQSLDVEPVYNYDSIMLKNKNKINLNLNFVTSENSAAENLTSDMFQTSESCFEQQESSIKPFALQHDGDEKATASTSAVQYKEGQSMSCCECPYNTYYRGDLEKHIQKHSVNKLKCDKCHDIFFNDLKLENHKRKFHSLNNKFKCDICFKSYTTKRYLYIHKKYHNSPKLLYYCNECPLTYARKSSLQYHICNVHLMKCPECKKCFKTRDIVNKHCKEVHSTLRLYACGKCDKSFKSSRTLEQHSIVHIDTRAFNCHHCDKNFKTKSLLKTHINRMHSKKIMNYRCDICCKKFSFSERLRSHMLFVHSNKYKYPCTKCSSKFKTAGHLNRHILCMHTDLKPFECPQCNKKFKTAYNLKLHGKVHSKERPFKCSDCKSAFKSNQELKGHFQRMHTTERPYKCQYCNRSFVASSDLHVHVNVNHKQLKKYPCDKCSEIFNCASNLRSHKVRWHNVATFAKKLVRPKVKKIFKCSNCLYSTSFKSNLTRHIVSHCSK